MMRHKALCLILPNSNGPVEVNDILVLIANWGVCP